MLSTSILEEMRVMMIETYDTDKDARRPVVVELVFEEGDLGVEKDRIWAGELGEGDALCSVLWVCRDEAHFCS